MREVTFAKRLPKRRRNARRIVEAVLTASGYCFDIQRIYDIKVPSGKRYRYRFCVYDMSPDAPGYDADAYEIVEKGRRDRRMAWFDVTIVAASTKWLYGHRGFKAVSVSTYSELPGPVPEPLPICSEAECFGMFVDDMLNGYLNGPLPRLPKIASEEELRIWLATVGV